MFGTEPDQNRRIAIRREVVFVILSGLFLGTLAVLNILAFLFHTILSFTDKRYQLMRDTLPRRDMFFQDIAALFRYMLFSDWDHLLLHMLTAFELEDPG